MKIIVTRLSNIGVIYQSRGDYDNALQNFTEALKIDEQLIDRITNEIQKNATQQRQGTGG